MHVCIYVLRCASVPPPPPPLPPPYPGTMRFFYILCKLSAGENIVRQNWNTIYICPYSCMRVYDDDDDRHRRRIVRRSSCVYVRMLSTRLETGFVGALVGEIPARRKS